MNASFLSPTSRLSGKAHHLCADFPFFLAIYVVLAQTIAACVVFASMRPCVETKARVLDELCVLTHVGVCSLTALFIVFNDESAYVRSLAIRLAGRLAAMNPAYVLPALRNHLQQLLTDMERSPDSRQREGDRLYTLDLLDIEYSCVCKIHHLWTLYMESSKQLIIISTLQPDSTHLPYTYSKKDLSGASLTYQSKP